MIPCLNKLNPYPPQRKFIFQVAVLYFLKAERILIVMNHRKELLGSGGSPQTGSVWGFYCSVATGIAFRTVCVSVHYSTTELYIPV